MADQHMQECRVRLAKVSQGLGEAEERGWRREGKEGKRRKGVDRGGKEERERGVYRKSLGQGIP